MLLSTGERIACALVAMAIHDLGEDAVSYTGSQAGILTDAAHTRAKIREIRGDRIRAALDAGQDRARRRLPGLLARHDGDHDARPRRHRRDRRRARGGARRRLRDLLRRRRASSRPTRGSCPTRASCRVVSYDEMLEMAASGAKVLMLRSVELARNHGVRIHARSTFSDEEGTWVQDAEEMEQPIVSAVTHSETDVVFTLTGIPDRPGVAAMIFDAVARGAGQRRHDHPERRPRRAEMSFSVPAEDVAATRGAIASTQAELGAYDVEENDGSARSR